MKRSHKAKISAGQTKSWRKGGASRLAFEKRMRAKLRKASNKKRLQSYQPYAS